MLATSQLNVSYLTLVLPVSHHFTGPIFPRDRWWLGSRFSPLIDCHTLMTQYVRQRHMSRWRVLFLRYVIYDYIYTVTISLNRVCVGIATLFKNTSPVRLQVLAEAYSELLLFLVTRHTRRKEVRYWYDKPCFQSTIKDQLTTTH